ncbi:MAG: hypothetical protein JXR76_04170 [Deltaproteobacteria bacterium]|nr:hypothetical protein [Deltaproteobacteria bacterium]
MNKFIDNITAAYTHDYADTHALSLKAVYDHIGGFGNVEDEVLVGRVRERCLQMFMNCMPAKYRTVTQQPNML